MLNKSLHACRLSLRTKANRCNHGHSTSRISEVIDTQHHVSLRYSKRSLCAACRRIFPGTRSVRGGKMRVLRKAPKPQSPKSNFQISIGANWKQETAFGRQTPTNCDRGTASPTNASGANDYLSGQNVASKEPEGPAEQKDYAAKSPSQAATLAN